jgi:DNA primase catalytic core, N-terminal domain
LIRFVELSRHLSFRESVACLQKNSPPTAQLLTHTAAFSQLELHRYPEGIQYLAERGVHDAKLIEELGIGYARGGNLRPHLQALGYCLERLPEAGLMGPKGPDTLCRRVIFPCRQQDPIVNLYGRSMGNAFPHRLLPHWPVNRPVNQTAGALKGAPAVVGVVASVDVESANAN